MSSWFTPSLMQKLGGYAPLALFLAVGAALGVVLTALAWIRGVRRPDVEKLAPYECGFAPTGDLRAKFDVRFYLTAVLFIIFDVEIVFLVPWAVSFGRIGFLGYLSGVLFLLVLTVGFIYEWGKGALEWE